MIKRGAITFVFDDGYAHILQDIVPLLNSLHIKAVFAIPTNPQTAVMDGQSLAPVTSWQSITAQGHELAAHGISHKDLTTVSGEVLEKELQEPARALSAQTVVYPGGACNAEVLAVAKKYYQAGRGVTKGFETIPVSRPWQLKTYNFTRHNFSVTKANLLVLWAYLTNSWLIETYHIVLNDNTTSKYAISHNDFMRHLAFVTKLPIAIGTIEEFTSPAKKV